jgi:hypothetical protein
VVAKVKPSQGKCGNWKYWCVGSLCALLAVLRPTLSVAVCVDCVRDDA